MTNDDIETEAWRRYPKVNTSGMLYDEVAAREGRRDGFIEGARAERERAEAHAPADDERIVRASIHGDVDAIRAFDRLLRRTVQGEPEAPNSEPVRSGEHSDAKVLAALNARWRIEGERAGHPMRTPSVSLDDWGSEAVETMRAILRAAAEVER